MTIFIIDRIGVHSGMHYYDESFRKILLSEFRNVVILSNYSGEPGSELKLFENYFTGHPLAKAFKFIKSVIRYYWFILWNRNDTYIFLNFGNLHELLLMLPLLITRHFIVDIHEVFNLIDGKIKPGSLYFKTIKFFYNHFVKTVITHSERSCSYLDMLGYKGNRLQVTHFKYSFHKESDPLKIPDSIKKLIRNSRINVLFFGFIRLSKGIDLLVKTIQDVAASRFADKYNFIIAGNDPDHLLDSFISANITNAGSCSSSLLRYVSDDELKYLFVNCDYIYLPYIEISQSGVLHMAVHFRKPVITSSIKYFKEFLDKFPSFGFYCPSEKYKDYISLFSDIADKHTEIKFYDKEDISRFTENQNSYLFLESLKNMINN